MNGVAFFLTNTMQDVDNMKSSLLKAFNISEQGFRNIDGTYGKGRCITEIIELLKLGKISFIEWKIIQDMISFYGEDDFFQKYQEKQRKEHMIEALMEEYIKDQISNFDSKCLANMILYLLSLDEKRRFKNAFTDFKNISFYKKSQVERAVNRLEQIGLIRGISDKSTPAQSSDFEIAHDFIREAVLKYERDNLDPEIRKNIDYYHYNKQKKRGKIQQLNKYYESYVDDNSFKIMNISLRSALVAIGLCHFVYYAFCIMDKNMQWIEHRNDFLNLLLISIAAGTSTFYTYNVYSFYFKIYGKIFFLWSGAVAIAISYAFPQLFGLCYGSAIIVVGLYQWTLRCKARDAEKQFFERRCVIFTLIGICITLIGVSIAFWGMHRYVYIFMGLYIAFLGFSIGSYVKEQYRIAVLGKFIYSDSGMVNKK